MFEYKKEEKNGVYYITESFGQGVNLEEGKDKIRALARNYKFCGVKWENGHVIYAGSDEKEKLSGFTLSDRDSLVGSGGLLWSMHTNPKLKKIAEEV